MMAQVINMNTPTTVSFETINEASGLIDKVSYNEFKIFQQ